MQKATVKIYTGSDWRNVTGRIVYRPTSGTGLAIEDERGVRHWATMDRVKLHVAFEPQQNYLFDMSYPRG